MSETLEIVARSTVTRRPHWLHAPRLQGYARLCVFLFTAVALGWFASARHGVDRKGKPLGYDFITYWSASRLALDGRAADAYSIPLIAQVEKQVVPASNDVFAWYYPPAFYLLVLPLARLPYLVALAVFLLITLVPYVFLVRLVVRGRLAMWCLAGFSGLWINLLQGQNGFLTASLAGGALLALEESPAWAGMLIGLLAIKPHLALLFPVALAARRAWRTMAVAAVTAAAVTALGIAVLGWQVLPACVGSLHQARQFLEDGSLAWTKMPTVFAFLRLLGAPAGVAYGVHGLVALWAAMMVWRVWRTSSSPGLRGAALMTGSLLVSPYLFDYDLAWLAFPIGWLALDGVERGWPRGEREILLAAWLLPFAMAPLGMLHVQPGPWVLGALLWCVVRRVVPPPPVFAQNPHPKELSPVSTFVTSGKLPGVSRRR